MERDTRRWVANGQYHQAGEVRRSAKRNPSHQPSASLTFYVLGATRIWGIWNEDLLPVHWETVQVGLRDAYKVRRVYRRLAKRKGSSSLRRITVFIRYENVVRLLKFLGYCLE